MIKNILKDSVIYGLANAFNKFFLLLIFLIFVKFFNKENIAVLDMIVVFSYIITIFTSMQLESSFGRFYFNKKEVNKHYELMKTISFLMMVTAIVYIIPAYLIYLHLFEQYNIPNMLSIFALVIISSYLYNISNIVNFHFRCSNEKKEYVISNLIFPIIFLILVFVNFISQFFGYLGTIVYQYTKIGSNLFNAKLHFDNLRDIIFYALPMFPMFFLIFANEKAIIYILNEFISLGLLADFSVATKFLAFLSLVFFALRMALEPKINHFISFPSKEKAIEYEKYINMYILISSVTFLVFIAILPYLQEYFFKEYTNSSKWGLILGLSVFLLNMGSYMTPGFAIKKRMDIKLIIVLFQVIFNFVGFYLVLKNGYDVLLALNYLVIINYVFMLVQHYYSNRLYKVSNEYLKATVVFLVLFIIVNKDFIV
jgi:O-antigen/teichoic acid export membrane protein